LPLGRLLALSGRIGILLAMINNFFKLMFVMAISFGLRGQVGAAATGSNGYEDNCGNKGTITITQGPKVGGVQTYSVVLDGKTAEGIPFHVEQVMIGGSPMQGQGGWLLRGPADNGGWFDSIASDSNPTHGLTHASISPQGGTGSVFRGPQQ
jgi:hypothetical protein